MNRDALTMERGSASIWAAGGIAAVLLLVALTMGLGAAAHTRHRAASAADLAALAAAGRSTAGQQAACAQAGWVADRMRVQLTACRIKGWDAEVEVAAQPPDLLIGFGTATARARAGPVAE
jgi:secretion/DNA translocation related TadE-like protein